jgi:hypothetical protein
VRARHDVAVAHGRQAQAAEVERVGEASAGGLAGGVEIGGEERVVDECEGHDEQDDIGQKQERQHEWADQIQELVSAHPGQHESHLPSRTPHAAIHPLADGAVTRARMQDGRVDIVDDNQQEPDSRRRAEDGLHAVKGKRGKR